MEDILYHNQLKNVEWLTYEDDPKRIVQIVNEPKEIGNTITNLIERLNDRAVHAYGVEGTVTNEKVKEKMKILGDLVDEYKEELDKNDVFLYLGGSLLYQDPSKNPDYDLVAYSYKDSKEKKRLS